jgi:UDP-glucose:(heptosyl)LPS alpha-1,3-glucosyltransferase
MSGEKQKYRLAVVSPFLDKRHGSERIMVEWISHLPDMFDVHIYSQRVEDMDPAKFTWHRIPKLPGPHLFNFLWWFVAVHLWVGWDQRFRGLQYDLLFSSGADWPGADVICVHIVFPEYVRQVLPKMSFLRNAPRNWPLLIHRKLYYAFVMWLERRAYTNPETTLVAHSRKSAQELARLYDRSDRIAVLHLGLDHSVFRVAGREALRAEARANLGIDDSEFAIVLVGNDWRNKGVPVLLEALEQLRQFPISLMLVSREDLTLCRKLVGEKGLEGRVRFLPPRKDIDFYYAAADMYAGPSLQDSYAMPPAEAMACGLPVIVSASAGVSEIVTDGVDGLILDDPQNAQTLAAMIRRLYEDKAFRTQLGDKAAETTLRYTWERNGRDLSTIFEEILRRKARPEAQRLTQEL